MSRKLEPRELSPSSQVVVVPQEMYVFSISYSSRSRYLTTGTLARCQMDLGEIRGK